MGSRLLSEPTSHCLWTRRNTAVSCAGQRGRETDEARDITHLLKISSRHCVMQSLASAHERSPPQQAGGLGCWTRLRSRHCCCPCWYSPTVTGDRTLRTCSAVPCNTHKVRWECFFCSVGHEIACLSRNQNLKALCHVRESLLHLGITLPKYFFKAYYSLWYADLLDVGWWIILKWIF
jgi:hypothetical protein